MRAAFPKVCGANDNEPWPDESYFRLIELSGKVLAAIIHRLSGHRSIDAQEIAEIIRQVCRHVAEPPATPCPGMMAIESVAHRLEKDDRCQ